VTGLILEGAEKQFKSTIANELSARLELPIIHFHKDYGFVNGQFDYFDGYLRDARKNSNGIIFDRNFLSEIVYGKHFRNRCHIDDSMLKKIQLEFNELGYLLVLLHRKNNYVWEEDEYLDEKQNDLMMEKYKKEFDGLNIINKLEVDSSDPGTVDKIINVFLEKE